MEVISKSEQVSYPIRYPIVPAPRKGKSVPPVTRTDEEPLSSRLRELCKRWPQAEIARRTGASSNNVSRYMRGVRIPLDFGVALVRGLGINPAWLMMGEGTPLLSDVSGATE